MAVTSAVVVGIDWAKDEHQVCVLDVAGEMLDELTVEHSGPGVRRLAERLLELGGGTSTNVVVGIEVPRGALVETLMERGFRVFALNPKQMDRFRDRHFPSGAKDDRRDAYVIADSLRTDQKCFREVRLDDPLIVQLRELSRVDEDLRAEANRLGNRMRELLYRYFPQALDISPAGDESWLLDLLERAPTPERARRLRKATIGSILKKRRIRRIDPTTVRTRLRALGLSVAPGTEAAAVPHVKLLIPRIRLVRAQRRSVRADIGRLLTELAAPAAEADDVDRREHRDAEILQSLPGVGIVVAATMLAEAHWALTQRDYRALRAHAGIAPVTKASGKRRHGGPRRPTVLMRQACNDRLRNAVYHWARVAAQHDAATKRHYTALRARGHTHGRALRGVADRLFRILIAMLRDGTLFDPTRTPKPARAAA